MVCDVCGIVGVGCGVVLDVRVRLVYDRRRRL